MTILVPDGTAKTPGKEESSAPSWRDPRPVTDPVAFEKELAMNRIAYENLKRELREQHAGKYAAIAFGRLITIAATMDRALTAIEALVPAPQHVLVFPTERGTHFGVILDL